MHLVIINCSPRTVAKSNTNLILQSFIKGYTSQGNTVELYHLSKRQTWSDIQQAYEENSHILMAIPLFVECIPGLMMQFLESLTPKTDHQTTLSFLLQGGFTEASQLRCCEQYLQQLPSQLGCQYGGTLIKGGMFITHMMPKQTQEQMTQPFYEMGTTFANDGCFIKEKADTFAGEEYSSKSTILLFTIIGPIQRLFFERFFKNRGCQTKLSAKPYENNLSK